MKIILHIGIPKTGSSFLQEWLTVNSGKVASLPAHLATRLATECCDGHEFGSRSDFVAINQTPLSSVKAHLSEIAAAGVTEAVISSEYFYLAKPGATSLVLSALGLHVTKVICFLRRQDDLLASGYAQDVKGLFRTDPFDLEKCNDQYDWYDLQSEYRKAFPSARFVPLAFEHLRQSGTLLLRWKAELGCAGAETVDTIGGDRLVNASLPGELVEVCRVANQMGGPSLNVLALWAADQRLATSAYRLPKEARVALWERYATRNDLFVSAADNPADFERYTSSGWVVDEEDMSTHLSPELVAHLLVAAISGSYQGGTAVTAPARADHVSRSPTTLGLHGHGMRGPRRIG